ncbi:MAG: helix-turn-helix transcriptional regulator [Pseudomonadota bacterium]
MPGRRTGPFRAIGLRLAELREERGLTQRELAEILELPRSYISKLETAERRLDVLDLARLADALSVSRAELLQRLLPD